jgi:hypothetical protein
MVIENIIKSLTHTIKHNTKTEWKYYLHIEMFTQMLADLSEDSQEVSF